MARISSLDYSNLTPFEQNIAKRVIPFYGFMKQNLVNQLNTFSKSPGTLVNQQTFLKDLGKSLSDKGMTEEDWNALPDWMKTGMSIAMGKNGNNVDILTGFGDTTSAVNDFIGSNPQETVKKLLSSSNPLVKMPIELGTGQNLFTGKSIQDSTDASRYKDYPEAVKNFIGYKELKGTKSDGTQYTTYKADPDKIYMLENLPFLSPANTMVKRIDDTLQDPKYLINLLSGGRIYSKDLVRESAAREKELKNKLNTNLENMGLVSPAQGVAFSKSSFENYPGLLEYLMKNFGYKKPKTQTAAQTKKKADTKVKNEAFLEQILSQNN